MSDTSKDQSWKRPDIIWNKFEDKKPESKKDVLTRVRKRVGNMKYAYSVCSFTRPVLDRPEKYAWDYWVYHSIAGDPLRLSQDREIEEDIEWADLGE